jgi:hypothetical protein
MSIVGNEKALMRGVYNNQLSSVLLGRYILLKYSEEAFIQDAKLKIISDTNIEPNAEGN